MLGDKNKTYTVVNPKTGWVGVLKGSHYIRPNFQVAEFACSDGSGIILVNSETLDACQTIKDYIKKKYNKNIPITINSANRTAQYNIDIGGAGMSYHVSGDAVDLAVPNGFTKKQFLKDIYESLGEKTIRMGIGENYSTFVHIDFRGYCARW